MGAFFIFGSHAYQKKNAPKPVVTGITPKHSLVWIYEATWLKLSLEAGHLDKALAGDVACAVGGVGRASLGRDDEGR